MSSDEAGYPPLNVLKPVADGLWIVDGPPVRTAGLTLPVRMTVVRLSSGDIWLHSPTRHDDALRRSIEELGTIRHLVAPNVGHWMSVGDWHRHCPGAAVWAAPLLRDRRQVRRSGLRVDRELGACAPEAWAAEIDQEIVPGAAGFREVAFLHRASRTLILTDLAANLEPGRLPPTTRLVARLTGMAAPDGRAPVYLRLAVRMRRAEASRAVRRIIGWQPERVVFAHGRCWLEDDANAALQRSFRWLLD